MVGSNRVIQFVEQLTTTTGDLAGAKFRLREWQKDIIRAIYDPVHEDGRRVVRQALITMPRKNGKTELSAALALYHLLADGEKGAQVYSAAADRNQASIIFNAAAAMIRADPYLEQWVNIIESTKRLVHAGSGSFFQSLSSDAKSKHGFNASCIIYDELAQAPTRELYDVLTTSVGARSQPLSIVISTVSDKPHSIMTELVDYGRKVRGGVIDDPTFHATIYEAPADADIWDEHTWHAANPALGDFRSLDEMRTYARRAKRIPQQESTFRNLYLNQPVDADARFLSSADWDACAEGVNIDALAGRPCYGGLDLSSVRDLTSFVLVFPDEDTPSNFDVLAWFWTAGDTAQEREESDKVPYRVWADQGLMFAPPGRSIDKEVVARQVIDLCARFDVRSIAYDRYGMPELLRILSDAGAELPFTEFGQGYVSMAPAVSALEAAVLDGRLRHGGHPVLRWNVANAKIDTDPAGNRKLNKMKSTGRIDGLVALTMALGRATQMLAPPVSIYDTERPEGFLVL